MLQGGLGNQISILLAAFTSCTNSKMDAYLDIAHLQHHSAAWENTFLGFSFINSDLSARERQRIFDTREKTCTCALNFVFRNNRQSTNLSISDSGYVGMIPLTGSGGQFTGDFQSYRYFDQAVNSFEGSISSSPLNSSPAYQKTIDMISRKSTLGIHLRRGDYQNNPKHWGMLTNKYYEEALNQFCFDKFDLILLFSDDKHVESPLAIDSRHQTTLERSNKFGVLSVVEEHSVFSLCKYQIIANSSFSWSAAVLSKNTEVVYPKPWFAVSCNFTDQFRLDWRSCQSGFS
jgi:hypothetical protein